MNVRNQQGVYVRGIGQLKVEKESKLSIREMGALAITKAIEDADIDSVCNMRERRLNREGLVLHREDKTVRAHVQGCNNCILDIREVFLADRNPYAKEFIVRDL